MMLLENLCCLDSSKILSGVCWILQKLLENWIWYDNIFRGSKQHSGKLHDGSLVNVDSTTSNKWMRSFAYQLVLIKFGLSITSTLPDDKAVDLYVLEMLYSLFTLVVEI